MRMRMRMRMITVRARMSTTMLTHRKIVMPSIIQQHTQINNKTLSRQSKSHRHRQSTCNEGAGEKGGRIEREGKVAGERERKNQILSDTICILVGLPQATNE